MKTKRLVRLQLCTGIALVAYTFLAGYLFFTIPTGQPIWSSMTLANSEIKTADLPRLQNDLREAVSSLATFRHEKNQLLLICLAATVGVVGFFGWSLFSISRVKKEVSRVA
jgi:hypothetical protein